MKALSRAIDRFCYKHRRFGIPRLMLYIVAITAVFYIVSMMDTTGLFLRYFYFDPGRIFRGEIWRLISWVFYPSGSSLLFVALSLYFYYFIGSTLESEWGTARFTVYYVFGVLFNVVYGLIIYIAFKRTAFLTPGYLNLSMFFAFAVLFPDQIVRLFFIIPIKIKWLALIDAGFFVFFIITALMARNYISALLPVIAILNFFLLCGDDLLTYLRPLRAKTSPQTIKFKKAARQARREYAGKPFRHKCAVCGRTDTDNPELEFRYCSRCEGYHCFCIDHINNHVHFN